MSWGDTLILKQSAEANFVWYGGIAASAVLSSAKAL
jgi:hypothetical protein